MVRYRCIKNQLKKGEEEKMELQELLTKKMKEIVEKENENNSHKGYTVFQDGIYNGIMVGYTLMLQSNSNYNEIKHYKEVIL